MEVRAVDPGAPSNSGTNSAVPGVGAGVFQYVQGSNGASAGQFVYLNNNSAVLITAAPGISSAFPVGVQAGALTGTAQYGWVQRQGVVDYARCTNHSFAAGIAVWPGSTAGYVGSVSSAGGRIYGIYPPVSNHSSLSAGSMTFMLDRPFVLGITGSI
jgi:hypothetical protein